MQRHELFLHSKAIDENNDDHQSLARNHLDRVENQTSTIDVFRKEYDGKECKNSSFVFLKPFENSKRIFFVQNKITNSSLYLLKENEAEEGSPSFYHPEIIRKIFYSLTTEELAERLNLFQALEEIDEEEKETIALAVEEIQALIASHQPIHDDLIDEITNLLLPPSLLKIFRAQIEIFAGEFIKNIKPNCCPKYRLFTGATKQDQVSTLTQSNIYSFFVGSTYYSHFRKSSLVYRPNEGNGTIDHFPITHDLTVLTTTDEKPIIDLGTCATLRYILGKGDCHNGNWGFLLFSTHYQVMLLDFGACLDTLRFTKLSDELLDDGDDEEDNHLIIKNINNIVKIVFENDKDDEPPLKLPSCILASKRITQEIVTTVESLKKVYSLEELIKVLGKHLHQFPHHIETFADDIRGRIEHLDSLIQKNLRLSEHHNEKAELDSAPKKIARK